MAATGTCTELGVLGPLTTRPRAFANFPAPEFGVKARGRGEEWGECCLETPRTKLLRPHLELRVQMRA